MPSYKSRETDIPSPENQLSLIEPFSHKIGWFLSKDYSPHFWQTLFHTLANPTTTALCRIRHLVAGRRGGKTLSAAWDIVYYLCNPDQFFIDAHRRDPTSPDYKPRPLVVWVLTKDYPSGLPALMTFREVLLAAGLENNKHYKENRANRWFEFNDGSWVFFKTADDPDSLRGAGLDILWIDEAAFIPTDDAWNVVRPALSEKEGIVITTTTPADRNWFHELFWSKEAVADPRQGRVEYWSIDNPYFPVDEWKYAQQTMHPLLFAREFCASFDAMAGIELSGDWLHYYADTADDKNNVITIPRDKDNRPVKLDYYIGVDPAISLKDTADKFAMACIGVAKDTGQVFLIDTFASRVPFSEQLDLIAEWHHRFHPHLIGIESIAYQAALAQQAVRLPNLPPILPIFSRGKKSERILSMAPLFRIGKVRIRRDHRDFIDEWVNYDTAPKNPRDDLLDAVEIALKAAGALLPASEDTPLMIPYGFSQNGSQSLDELAWSSFSDRQSKEPFDPELGTVW